MKRFEKQLNMEEIKRWFDPDKWDIGYITKEQLKICSYSPIKYPSQSHGWNFSNHMRFNWLGISNGLVLIRYTIEAFDYSLYDEVSEILNQHGLKELSDWVHIYTNFKEAEIHSGRGVRARNSLVYNYKFGFDSKVCVIGFMKTIQNLPKIKRVAGNNFKDRYWHNCIGCDACREVCPVGAIHNNKDIDWLDSNACVDFLEFGDHPRIPSMQTYWKNNPTPEYTKEMIDEMTNEESPMKEALYTNVCYDKKPIPQCRECQVQAPCSKWGGEYPYG